MGAQIKEDPAGLTRAQSMPSPSVTVTPGHRHGQGHSSSVNPACVRQGWGNHPRTCTSPPTWETSTSRNRAASRMRLEPLPAHRRSRVVSPFQDRCDKDIELHRLAPRPGRSPGPGLRPPPARWSCRGGPARRVTARSVRDRIPGNAMTSQPSSKSWSRSQASRSFRDRDNHGDIACGLGQPARDRQPSRAVEHDPRRTARAGRASGEEGIVGFNGGDPDQDRIHSSPQLVDQDARLIRRDPSTIPRGCRRLAIQSHGPLGR